VNKVAALTVSFLVSSCPAVFGQDAMQYGVKHLTVLAEDQKVRVLQYAPHKGDKDSDAFSPIGSGVCAQRRKG
jgi:hypothetical protein